MNSQNINSVINNLCDKLGTTANKLVPEMAGYQIAKHSIWLVISFILLGVTVFLLAKIIKIHKEDGIVYKLYPDQWKKLQEEFEKYSKDYPPSGYRESQWQEITYRLSKVCGYSMWDTFQLWSLIFASVWTGLIGAIIFGISLTKVIGWALVPNAMTFMWIL